MLGNQALPIDASLSEEVERAVPLTQYAWRFRYPGDPEEPEPEEARHALNVARELHEAILARLPEEVHP